MNLGIATSPQVPVPTAPGNAPAGKVPKLSQGADASADSPATDVAFDSLIDPAPKAVGKGKASAGTAKASAGSGFGASFNDAMPSLDEPESGASSLGNTGVKSKVSGGQVGDSTDAETSGDEKEAVGSRDAAKQEAWMTNPTVLAQPLVDAAAVNLLKLPTLTLNTAPGADAGGEDSSAEHSNSATVDGTLGNTTGGGSLAGGALLATRSGGLFQTFSDSGLGGMESGLSEAVTAPTQSGEHLGTNGSVPKLGMVAQAIAGATDAGTPKPAGLGIGTGGEPSFVDLSRQDSVPSAGNAQASVADTPEQPVAAQSTAAGVPPVAREALHPSQLLQAAQAYQAPAGAKIAVPTREAGVSESVPDGVAAASTANVGTESVRGKLADKDGMGAAMQQVSMKQEQPAAERVSRFTFHPSADDVKAGGARAQGEVVATSASSSRNSGADAGGDFKQESGSNAPLSASESGTPPAAHTGMIAQPAAPMHGVTSTAHAGAAEAQAQANQTAAILQRVTDVAERMHTENRGQMELQLKLKDGQNLTIQLKMVDGELRPLFKTDSTDLKQALEQGWSQFATSMRDNGMRMSPPAFESPGQGLANQNQNQSQNQNPQRQTQSERAQQGETFTLPGQKQLVKGTAAHAVSLEKPAQTSGLSLFA